MRILVACEESQAVTIELRKIGIEAFSCDIDDCSGGHPEWHIKDDVLKYINNGWDCIIAFPPCTYLANVSSPHYNVAKWGDKALKRMVKREQALRFFETIKNADCPFIAIENPQPSKFLIEAVGYYDQIVQPYYYGNPYTKKTCLWIKGLPHLTHELKDYVDKGKKSKCTNGGSNADWYFRIKSDKHRAKNRSKTFPGIAKAMAEQWGGYMIMKDLL